MGCGPIYTMEMNTCYMPKMVFINKIYMYLQFYFEEIRNFYSSSEWSSYSGWHAACSTHGRHEKCI